MFCFCPSLFLRPFVQFRRLNASFAMMMMRHGLGRAAAVSTRVVGAQTRCVHIEKRLEELGIKLPEVR